MNSDDPLNQDANSRGGAGWFRTALLVLATFLLVMANVGYWFQNTVLDRGEFTSKVDGVLQREEASQRIGEVLAQQALSSGEIEQQIAVALPVDAALLPELLEEPLTAALTPIFAGVLTLDAVRDVIVAAVGQMHDLVVSTLEGREDGLAVEDGSIVLKLDEAAGKVLDELGVSAPQGGGDRDIGTIVLVEDVKGLDQASSLIRTLDVLVPVMLVGSVAAFGGSFALSRSTPQGFKALGYAIVIAGVASLIAWRLSTWGSSAYLDEAPGAKMMIESLASNLKVQSLILGALGVIVVLGAEKRSRNWVSETAAGHGRTSKRSARDGPP